MLWWDISLQCAGSLQLSVKGLHFAPTFECGGGSAHPGDITDHFQGQS